MPETDTGKQRPATTPSSCQHVGDSGNNSISGDKPSRSNRHGEVCHAGKLGGAPVDALTLLHCTRVAAVRAQELSRLVKEALERDAKQRDQGGRMAAELSAENAR